VAFLGTPILNKRFLHNVGTEENMPILLLIGIPVVVVGGGYLIIHAIH
jgi:hypothetical protein